MTNSVPEKLGKYKIIEEVGRGGFAAVYKAVDTTLDRTVALKVLAPHLLWDPTFVQRFQQEAKVAANLDHPNIVTIYDVGQIEGVYFIAMQFLEGRTLSQILGAEGALPVSRVQAIIEQIAAALDYAHARDFVHRDIKPSNVIVADDGRATLTDFGLVKAGEGTKLSTTGVVFGTPEYMSPEQAEGKKLDVRSDVYSLGVVLYEMLAGRVPFVAENTPAVMYKHVHELPPLEELPSDLSQGVMVVVEKALAKKREDRFASAGAMAAALQLAVSEPAVEEPKAPPEPEKPAPAPVPPLTVPTPPPRPERLISPSLLLITIGWTLGWGIGGAVGGVIFGAMGMDTGGFIGGAVTGIIAGIIGALVTGLALRQVEPSISWKQVLIVALGWAIDWTILGAMGGFFYGPLEMDIIVGVTGGAVGGAVGGAIAGVIGGLITGLALRRTGRSFQWKRVPIVAIGWALGAAIGLSIGLSIGWTTGTSETLDGFSQAIIGVIGGVIAGIMLGPIGGAIGGAIGGGVMFLLLSLGRGSELSSEG